MLAAFPELIHPNHQPLIDTWNHCQEDNKGGVGEDATAQRLAEKKLELGVFWSIILYRIRISEWGFCD